MDNPHTYTVLNTTVNCTLYCALYCRLYFTLYFTLHRTISIIRYQGGWMSWLIPTGTLSYHTVQKSTLHCVLFCVLYIILNNISFIFLALQFLFSLYYPDNNHPMSTWKPHIPILHWKIYCAQYTVLYTVLHTVLYTAQYNKL